MLGRMRQRALTLLPEPFCQWEAGEAFAAIVEMSTFSTMDATNSNGAPQWKSLRGGDFSSYTASDLVRGHRFAKAWPHSLELMLPSVLTRNTLNLQKLTGLFGRYFQPSSLVTPLAKLMKVEIPRLLAKGDFIPVPSSGVCPGWARRSGVVTHNEAAKKFEIDKTTLRRLRARGRCLIKSSEQRASILYDEHALGNSIRIWREAMREKDCARETGLPKYCVEHLRLSGLLKEIEDHDAILMAGEKLYDSGSLQQLRTRLESIPLSSGRGTRTLERLLQGRFHPADWTDAISAILSGELRIVRCCGASLIDAVVEEESAAIFLLRHPEREPPKEIVVSNALAGKLIGICDSPICAAVQQGFLVGVRGRRSNEISLFELARFHRRYITAAEGDLLLNLRPGSFSWKMRARGFQPLAKLNRTNVWYRRDAGCLFTDLMVDHSAA